MARHAEVRRLLADGRLGPSHRDPEHAPRINESIFYGGALGNFETVHARRT